VPRPSENGASADKEKPVHRGAGSREKCFLGSVAHEVDIVLREFLKFLGQQMLDDQVIRQRAIVLRQAEHLPGTEHGLVHRVRQKIQYFGESADGWGCRQHRLLAGMSPFIRYHMSARTLRRSP